MVLLPLLSIGCAAAPYAGLTGRYNVNFADVEAESSTFDVEGRGGGADLEVGASLDNYPLEFGIGTGANFTQTEPSDDSQFARTDITTTRLHIAAVARWISHSEERWLRPFGEAWLGVHHSDNDIEDLAPRFAGLDPTTTGLFSRAAVGVARFVGRSNTDIRFAAVYEFAQRSILEADAHNVGIQFQMAQRF